MIVNSPNGSNRFIPVQAFSPSSSLSELKVSAEWLQVQRYFKFVLFVFSFLLISICVFLSFEFNSMTLLYATSLGFASMFLSIWQFVPQIYIIWVESSIGSLSVTSMLIQTPGSRCRICICICI